MKTAVSRAFSIYILVHYYFTPGAGVEDKNDKKLWDKNKTKQNITHHNHRRIDYILLFGTSWQRDLRCRTHSCSGDSRKKKKKVTWPRFGLDHGLLMRESRRSGSWTSWASIGTSRLASVHADNFGKNVCYGQGVSDMKYSHGYYFFCPGKSLTIHDH